MNVHLCLALLALPYPAAPVPAGDEAIARKAAEVSLGAIRKCDWKALASTLDPASLEAFKTRATPALKHAAAPRLDKDGIPNFQDTAVQSMLNDADPNKLLALPPKEFFAAFVQAALPEGSTRLFAAMEARIVGTVHEGRDSVHVVYRAKGKVHYAEGTDDRAKEGVKKLKLVGEVTRLGVLTVKRSGGAWRSEVPGQLQELADLLTAEWKEK